MKPTITAFILLFSIKTFTQTNVRAWYADGQVFIVWQLNNPPGESYAIYASPDPFTNTAEATLIGRPFILEYLGYGLKDNLNDTTATFRVPDGQGSQYQLALNEGLFVFTPHQPGALYFSVNAIGNSTVVPGQNITTAAVPFIYNPNNDPVECHLQRVFPSPFSAGYNCLAFVLWADGRQQHWEGRPDFPIMANAAKNGMPSLFLVSVPVNLDTTHAFPLSVWLHGGGGIARQSLAGSRREVNIDPEQGILIAHDDKMYGYRGLSPVHTEQPTWHFGYRKNYDPFVTDTLLPADTVINYTQRRYLWVDQWLARNFNVDTNRINIHGHSMGSAGSIALVKSFPVHYGSATIFNTGCAGPDNESPTIYIFGTRESNLPTNLKNRNNEVVRFYDLWDLYSNCSSSRDIPLIRHWHGKNDDNGVMHWGPVVIANFMICDSTGTGIQHYWSERPHGVDLAPAFNDHWIEGTAPHQQTIHDDVRFAEAYHRSDESFPAFMNHRLDPKNNDPGTGLIGINNGDGDNWGTWGGYHRWSQVIETAQSWEATIWLESNALFPNENSPEDFLTADIAIRRPQNFKPLTGNTITWRVEDVVTGDTLQTGTAVVRENDVVVIPQVAVFKEAIRRSRVIVSTEITAVDEGRATDAGISVFPNPTDGFIYLQPDWYRINIIDMNGILQKQINTTNTATYCDLSDLTSGSYCIEVIWKDGERKLGRFIKIN